MKFVSVLILLVTQTVSAQVMNQTDFLSTLANQAEVVIVGEVACIDEAPGIWSGIVLSAQRVRYRVVEVMKGSLSNSYVDVAHYVVHNSKTADSKKPQLNLNTFATGGRLLLFLVPDTGKEYFAMPNKSARTDPKIKRFISFDANYGAVLADSETLQKVQQSIAPK